MATRLTRINVEPLHAFCMEAMCKCGMSEADAATTAEILVTTDTWGVFSHGTIALRQYLCRVRAGGWNAAGRPHIVREGPAWAIIDGDSAIGMVSSNAAMEVAIDKAKQGGVGFAGVCNGAHAGAFGYYAKMAADQGMIGIAMTNTNIGMVAPGSRGAIIGNNPIAFAAPTGRPNPVMLDMAMSHVAAGKISAMASEGKKIPENWLVDPEGKPTDDPSWFRRGGFLTPIAGHKGYGLALMVEILTAVLTGAGITRQIKVWVKEQDNADPTNHGQAFIAININAFMPALQFQQRLDDLCAEIVGTPTVEGTDRLYLPGDFEWQKRADALQNGIPFPENVIESLAGLANDAGLDLKMIL